MRHVLLTMLVSTFFYGTGGLSWAKTGLSALVIGVGIYDGVRVEDSSGKEQRVDLANTLNDARAIAAALEKERGFSVSLLADPGGTESEPDLERPARSAILARWKRILEDARDGDVVLFYFAGHGIELKGNNYLLPGDTVYRSKEQAQNRLNRLTQSSVEFQKVLEELSKKQQEAPNLIGIFIIDACRENPFDFSDTASGQLTVSLGPYVHPSQQFFIMYSAGSGQEARDGGAGNHSVFANELLRFLEVEEIRDIPLGEMAQRLRLAVYKAALPNIQTPAYYDQLKTSRTLSGDPGHPEKFILDNSKFGGPPRSLGHGDGLIECPYCPEMVVLREGAFEMGSPDQELGHQASEAPRHSAEVSKFAIGKYEVTNREWSACVREQACAAKDEGHEPGSEQKPVVNVSWDEAKDYLHWLSIKTGATYRLPTEAEWEYAARAGSRGRYYFGDDAARLCDFANGADRSLGILPYANQACDDGTARETSIVGRYKPNAWGLHDMLGNAWEWVEDCWHEDYLSAPSSGDPGSGNGCTQHAARGGSWRSGANALRTAARNSFPHGHRRTTLGFRAARAITNSPAPH